MINPIRRCALPAVVTFLLTSAAFFGFQSSQNSVEENDDVTERAVNSVEETEDVTEPAVNIPMNVDDPLCPLRYPAPADRGIPNRKGRPLVVDPAILKRMAFPYKKFVTLNKETVKEFIFATGASSNHRKEILDGIASVQHYFPSRRIMVYDLGLSPESRREFQLLCGVTVRVFNFTDFPPHVAQLKRYAWKPLIVQELLHEFPGVFWMDSSIRLRSSDLSAVYAKLLETDGILQFKDVTHTNFAVTNPKVYQYIPTNLAKQKTTKQSIATTLMAYRTESTYWHVIHWWVLCALVEDCISPITTKFCDFKAFGDKRTTYVGCHRFDQAVISLLNSNYFNFDNTRYTLDEDSRIALLSINRTQTDYNTLRICGIHY